MTGGTDQSREQTAQPQQRQSQEPWAPSWRKIGSAAAATLTVGVAMLGWILGAHGGITGSVTAGHILSGIVILAGLGAAGLTVIVRQMELNAERRRQEMETVVEEVVDQYRDDLAEATVIMVRAFSRLAEAVTTVVETELAQTEASQTARKQLGKLVGDMGQLQQAVDRLGERRWSDQQHTRRPKGRRSGGKAPASGEGLADVVPLPTREVREAARRLLARVTGEDKREDKR